MKGYKLIIDHESCWGCKTCEVACKQETLAPDGIKLISVYEEGPTIVEGKPEFVFRVNVCRHCDEPECVEALSLVKTFDWKMMRNKVRSF